MLKHIFPDYQYISLERPDVLERLQEDPLCFFQDSSKKWIIDEAQRFPALFSYLQDQVDQTPLPGRFILSGSENFLLSHHINQTLAGRAIILELLPLTYQEYRSYPALPSLDVWKFLFYGGYPRPYHEKMDHHLWMGNYIRAYVERDVRDLLHVKDLAKFTTFLKLCAGRHGQLLNMSALAIDAGISQTTATEWLSVLEASYILFRHKPFYKNFSKRLIKTPKLFFYDTGLVCYLLGIEGPQHLAIHSQRGSIFEGFVITEFIKHQLSTGAPSDFYFWRDHQGLEIDLLKEKGNSNSPLKSNRLRLFIKSIWKRL